MLHLLLKLAAVYIREKVNNGRNTSFKENQRCDSRDQTFTSVNLVSCNCVYLPDLIKFKCPLAALCRQYVSRSIWTSRSGSQDGRKSFDGEMCDYKTRLNLTLWEKTSPMLLNTETIHTSSYDWKTFLNITHILFIVSYIWLDFSYKLSSQRPLTTDCSDLQCDTVCSGEHLLNLTLSYQRVSLALCWILNYLQTASVQLFPGWLHTLSQPDISIMFKYIC